MAEHSPAPSTSRSVYGYALYIGSNILILLYIIWAFVPEDISHEYLGLTYWPSKYWAIAIPIWAITGIIVFATIVYPSINMLLTPEIDDIKTITDKYSVTENTRIPGGVPPISDIPISEVCKILYASGERENL